MRAKLCMFVAGVVLGLGTVPSQAQTRTWVSGVGDDLNPCSRTAPCKTFAGAISKTSANGEINALDPGGFGAVTITKSITISAEYTEGGVLNSNTTGVIINGAGINVVLRGLDIEGFQQGIHGINILNAATVTVEKCVINGQATGFGIRVVPTGTVSVFVKDTYIHNNFAAASGGIFAQGVSAALPVNLSLDNVRLEHNTFGLKVQDFVKAQVRNSAAIGNVNNGFWAFSVTNPAELNIENSRSALNGTAGVRAENANALVRITDVTITDNGVIGIQSATSGQILSFSNNRNAGNGAGGAVNGAPTGTILPQ